MRVFCCLPIIFAVGCYTYTPAPRESFEAGSVVRLTLTDSGSAVLGSLIGTTARGVEGRLAGDSGGVYVMRVNSVLRHDGVALRRSGEQMLIPHALVENLGARRLSRGRTFVLLGATSAVAIAAMGVVLHQTKLGSGSAPVGRPSPY